MAKNHAEFFFLSDKKKYAPEFCRVIRNVNRKQIQELRSEKCVCDSLRMGRNVIVVTVFRIDYEPDGISFGS